MGSLIRKYTLLPDNPVIKEQRNRNSIEFYMSFQVNVYSSVKWFELSCPPVVEASEEFGCPMSIYKGTNMRLDAQFTAGSAVSTLLDGKNDSFKNLLSGYSKNLSPVLTSDASISIRINKNVHILRQKLQCRNPVLAIKSV